MSMQKIETAIQAMDFINRNLTVGGQFLLDYFKTNNMDVEHEMWDFIRKCEQSGKSVRTELKQAMNQAYEFNNGKVKPEVEQAKVEIPGIEDAEAELLANVKKVKTGLPKVTRPKVVKVGGMEFDVRGFHIILTPLQVTFLKLLPTVSFWDSGVNSSLWIDTMCDDLAVKGFNAMTIGAMISTLREKGIVSIGVGKPNGHKVKFMELTDLGKGVMEQLGVK